jgi:hypothetical protein
VFDDATQNSTQSSSFSLHVVAAGGNGGTGDSLAAAGGAATATGTATGAGSATVSVESDAQGGHSNGATGANAVANATGTTGSGEAAIYAAAEAGSGNLVGGNATATATGNGGSGYADADAQTSVGSAHPTNAILSAEAKASATVSTAAISQAVLQYGTAAPAFVTTPQAVAAADLAPAASSTAVKGVLNANGAIASAFSGAAQYYAVGELGAGHATGGSDSETTTAQLFLNIDQTQVPAGGDLVVGLFGGFTKGSGVTGVSLSVTENGTAVSALSFSNDTATQAQAAFTDMGFNLGALSGGGTVALDFVLSVTSGSAGAGFYGGLIVGDPPSHAMPALLQSTG